jgi:hypothetical protein
MGLKDDIERSMLTETYNTRLANIADLVGANEDDVRGRMKTLDFKKYVDLMRALRDQNKSEAQEILGLGMDEAYSTGGTLSPGEMKGQQAAQQQAAASMPDPKTRAQKVQGMAKLGKKNIGNVTPNQAASALDKASAGQPLTPVQRQAMAQQAQSVGALASDPKTAVQFRNLLNKLNK